VRRSGLILLALIAVLAAVCASATAQRLGSVTSARAFIVALNAADRSPAVELLAPTVRFATADSPWAVYRGRARYDFVSLSFGENCAQKPLRASTVTRSGSDVVRMLVAVTADHAHPCVRYRKGVRVVYTMWFTQTGKIRALRIKNP
jgi:hypothetical protein